MTYFMYNKFGLDLSFNKGKLVAFYFHSGKIGGGFKGSYKSYKGKFCGKLTAYDLNTKLEEHYRKIGEPDDSYTSPDDGLGGYYLTYYFPKTWQVYRFMFKVETTDLIFFTIQKPLKN